MWVLIVGKSVTLKKLIAEFLLMSYPFISTINVQSGEQAVEAMKANSVDIIIYIVPTDGKNDLYKIIQNKELKTEVVFFSEQRGDCAENLTQDKVIGKIDEAIKMKSGMSTSKIKLPPPGLFKNPHDTAIPN